jgi:plastocyanin
MENSENVPVRLEIEVGDIVEWVNADYVGHTVTSAEFTDEAATWSFDEDVSGNDKTERRFDRAGIYEYYCTIHGRRSMCGAVLVGDVTLSDELPCEGVSTY